VGLTIETDMVTLGAVQGKQAGRGGTINSRHAISVHILVLLDVFGGERATSEWIARSVNTNPVVIRRLISRLRAKGLVESLPGQHGGYRLARPAAMITLLEIYRAVQEGSLIQTHRSTPNAMCPVGARIEEHLQAVYDQAEQALEQVLAGKTIAALKESILAEGMVCKP
jgi:Rrf2 family protein